MTDQEISSNLKEEFDELSIREMQILMERKELSSLELVDYYLDRIERIDKNGPALNSILEINPDARTIARSIDDNRSKRLRDGDGGLLNGIPILLKGNIDTADRMTTTAGSLALSGNTALKDAEIVQKLRKVGAVILGKANLSEWANFRSTKSTSGWFNNLSIICKRNCRY